jgi:O2-independent ubiquinone biosynthesis accessory factor UbiT
MEHTNVLPAPIGRLLSLLPSYPGSVLFAVGLNVMISRHLPGDLREALAGKTLRISVVDARTHFDFHWTNNRFSGIASKTEPDLTISANAHDFMLLASRQADPDTLFFCRRLMIAGDTELGLRVKNALDAIDGAEWEFPGLAPSSMLSFVKRCSGSSTPRRSTNGESS